MHSIYLNTIQLAIVQNQWDCFPANTFLSKKKTPQACLLMHDSPFYSSISQPFFSRGTYFTEKSPRCTTKQNVLKVFVIKYKGILVLIFLLNVKPGPV